ncbi:SPON2 protein, partial [Acromyrmex heyeri]
MRIIFIHKFCLPKASEGGREDAARQGSDWDGCRTHDSTYTLYRLGERLSTGARLYVETGRADGLDTDGDSPNSLHSFTGPPIPQGEGTSVTRAFLDGNHTLISIMARINPSPDWFVGVDSFQLCVEGNWVDTVTVELDPLDGGTDNGFTFTAANWPTQPQGIAYRITSRYPAHPAGSFYYPNLPRLPPIATLTFTKLREYTLTESYHEDEVEVEFVSNDNLQANSEAPRGIDPNRDLNEAIAEERREMDTQRYRYWSTTGSGQQVVTDIPRDNKAAIINSIATSYALQRPRYTATAIPRTSKVVVDGKTRYSETGKSDWPYYQTYRQTAETQKAQIYEDIQRKIANVSDVLSTRVTGYLLANNATNSVDQRQHRFRMKHHGLTSKGKRIRTRAPRDCKVGEWGPWSACSRSCGVGETQRTRKITIKPRRGGAPCPPLKETKWCGSVNPCSESKPIIDYHW